MKYKYNDEWKDLGFKGGDTLPIGTIVSFGGEVAPSGWLICDGSALNRTTYSKLFEAIGTKYGTGDGSTTFNIPNLKGKVLVGKDAEQTEFDTIGKIGGEKTHKLTVNEMPSHNHIETMGNAIAVAGAGSYHDTTTVSGEYNSNTTKASAYRQTTLTTGGGQSHNNLQPYLVANYIIKFEQSIGLVGDITNQKSTSTTDTYSCDYINKNIIIERVVLSDGFTLSGGDAKVWRVPDKTGYETYVLKPDVGGEWSDKYATVVPYNQSTGIGIRNDSNTSYTWTMAAYVLYIKKQN